MLLAYTTRILLFKEGKGEIIKLKIMIFRAGQED